MASADTEGVSPDSSVPGQPAKGQEGTWTSSLVLSLGSWQKSWIMEVFAVGGTQRFVRYQQCPLATF